MFAGEQQLGRYRLLKVIATGGMGEIHLAEDASINRQVAIKVMRSEGAPYAGASNAARLFEREAKAIAMLDHPHILPLYDYGEEKRNGLVLTYLVMPYRPEGSLASWLEQRGMSNPLSLEDVESIITQASSALQYTHEHLLIHQDVKPSNFLIRARKEYPNRPDILISDFGIARLSNISSGVSQSIRGTPGYMAPEQWEGHPLPASDQYALAVMTYELVTGRPPFKGNPMQMMFAHVNTPPQAPGSLVPGLPPALDAVLLRGLAKQPADRFPSISAFARAFQQAVRGFLSSHVVLTNPYATMPSPADTHGAGIPSDLSATLAISAAEALSGSIRQITLPDGSHISFSIPAGAHDGQVLELSNTDAAAGILRVVRLKLSVQAVPQDNQISSSTQQGLLPANDAQTYVSGAASAPADGTHSPTAAARWQSGMLPPSPAPVPGPQMPASPDQMVLPYAGQYGSSSPSQPQLAPFEATTSVSTAPPGPLLSSPPQRPSRRPQHKSSGLLIAAIVMSCLLILGGGALAYAIRGGLSSGGGSPTLTATGQTNSSTTSTAPASGSQDAQSTATANAQGTADAQSTVGALATSATQASANATGTASATNPYGGTLALDDPLSNNSQGHQWEINNDTTVGTSCQFTNGAYQMVMPTSYGGACLGAATGFSKFAFQVQMEFLSYGPHFSGEGLVFRGAPGNRYYVLEIFESGQYTFFSCNGNDCSHGIAGYPASSLIPSFHLGLNQVNTIAVVARDKTFTFYANGQKFAGPITDSTYSSGLIGFYDEGSQGLTKVAYANAKVWQL